MTDLRVFTLEIETEFGVEYDLHSALVHLAKTVRAGGGPYRVAVRDGGSNLIFDAGAGDFEEVRVGRLAPGVSFTREGFDGDWTVQRHIAPLLYDHEVLVTDVDHRPHYLRASEMVRRPRTGGTR